MVKKVILQSVDSPRRELEWRLFMSSKLSKKGFTSIIGSKTQIELIHERSKNCIFLGRLNSVTGRADSDIEYFKSMKRNKTKLFYLHDEGGFYFEGEYESAVKKIYPEEYFASPVIERVFFWGDKQREVFDSHVAEAKFIVSGSPRFDLLKDQYFNIDKDNIQRIRNKYGAFVLVCTRFGAANRVPDEPTTLSKRSYDIRIEGGSLQLNSKNEILSFMFKAWGKIAYEFSAFVPSVAQLAIDFPELNFVVRPHPAERMSFYKEAFSHFDNIFMDKSADVRPFIRASKLVIQSECSTGVEAEITQKANLNYRPCFGIDKFNGLNVAAVSNIGIVVNSYKSLSRELKKNQDNNFKFIKSSADISSYLRNFSTSCEASEIIISELEQFRRANTTDSTVSSLFTNSNFSFLQIKRYIKEPLRRLRNYFVFKRTNISGDSKLYIYSNKEIKKIWSDLGGKPECIKIKNGVIYISPEIPYNKEL